MENKPILKFAIFMIFVSIMNFITQVYLPDKTFDLLDVVVFIVIHTIVFLLFIPFIRKLDKMDKRKQAKWGMIEYLIIFYLSMILFKTHFVSNTVAEYYLWLENLLPILMTFAFIRNSSNSFKNKKLIFVETKALNRLFGGILLLVALFFLANKPLESILPKLFAWIEVSIAYAALFFARKLDPIFEIKEDT